MAYNDVERFVRPSNQRQSIINSIHSCTSIFLQVPIEAEARHPRRQRVSTVPTTVSWAHGMRFSRVFRHSIIPWSSLRLAPRIVLVTKRCRGSTGKSMIVVGLWLAWRRENRRFAAVEVDFEVSNCLVEQASEQTADNLYFECSKFGSVFLCFWQDLRAYVGDFLGFGQAETEQFFEEFSTSERPFIVCTRQETAGKQDRRWCDWNREFCLLIIKISQRFIERLDTEGLESTQISCPR